MKLRKITEEEKVINNPNATHIIDCRGLKIFLDEEEFKELVSSINNLPLQIVSCSRINCKYEDRGSYLWCEKHGIAYKKTD